MTYLKIKLQKLSLLYMDLDKYFKDEDFAGK